MVGAAHDVEQSHAPLLGELDQHLAHLRGRGRVYEPLTPSLTLTLVALALALTLTCEAAAVWTRPVAPRCCTVSRIPKTV